MLGRHATTISMINRDPVTAILVRDYFDLHRGQSLMASMLDKILGQADLVLCLLRLRDATGKSGDRRRLLTFYIHRLVGRPILVGESCLLKYRINGHQPSVAHVKNPNDQKIVWVLEENPRQPSTNAHLRWSHFRVGRTVEQLRVRGVTRRDIRRALRKNWIRMEELA